MSYNIILHFRADVRLRSYQGIYPTGYHKENDRIISKRLDIIFVICHLTILEKRSFNADICRNTVQPYVFV